MIPYDDMTVPYPTLKEIVAEQSVAQSGMTIDRRLGSYTKNFFRCITGTETQALDTLLTEAIPDWNGRHDVSSLLKAMKADASNGKTVWIDYGGGVGRAQADALADESLRSGLYAVNVDPLRHGVAKSRYFKDVAQASIQYVQADAVKYRAKYPAQFATAMFMLPYVHNPLKCIANIYRNLDDDGLMVLATDDEYSWTRGIVDAAPDVATKRPVTRFLEVLHETGIHFAAIGHEGDDEALEENQEFSCLWIKKTPNTTFDVVGDVRSIRTGEKWHEDHYKTVAYGGNPLESPIKIIS